MYKKSNKTNKHLSTTIHKSRHCFFDFETSNRITQFTKDRCHKDNKQNRNVVEQVLSTIQEEHSNDSQEHSTNLESNVGVFPSLERTPQSSDEANSSSAKNTTLTVASEDWLPLFNMPLISHSPASSTSSFS